MRIELAGNRGAGGGNSCYLLFSVGATGHGLTQYTKTQICFRSGHAEFYGGWGGSHD